MQLAVFLVGLLVTPGIFDIQAAPPPPQQQQKRPARPRTATLAVLVSDVSGAQIPNVAVTLEGPTPRSARTEGGRIAFENLVAGEYVIRFEKDGFLPLERQLTAKAGAPVDVKVTLKAAPAPPPPPPPVVPPPAKPSPVDAKPASVDVPGVAERDFVGRAPQKRTPLACGAGGTATLIQLNDPVADHAHADADEFLYVVAGEGAANVAGAAQRLRAGVLLFIPRGVTHRFSQSGRNPLIVMSTLAGEPCGGGQAP